MTGSLHKEFIGEEMKPVPGAADARAMARGEPGLPRRFTWRRTECRVVRVIEKWKSTGPCRSGGGEMYVRRHWYTVETEPPARLTVYCERRARDRRHPGARWWVYTAEPVGTHGSGGPAHKSLDS